MYSSPGSLHSAVSSRPSPLDSHAIATIIPDKPLSKQDGTRTSCSRGCPKGGSFTASIDDAPLYCQMPFRFCHGLRSSCGRGYSVHGLVPTFSVHGVSNGGVLTAYLVGPRATLWCCCTGEARTTSAAAASKGTSQETRRCIGKVISLNQTQTKNRGRKGGGRAIVHDQTNLQIQVAHARSARHQVKKGKTGSESGALSFHAPSSGTPPAFISSSRLVYGCKQEWDAVRHLCLASKACKQCLPLRPSHLGSGG